MGPRQNLCPPALTFLGGSSFYLEWKNFLMFKSPASPTSVLESAIPTNTVLIKSFVFIVMTLGRYLFYLNLTFKHPSQRSGRELQMHKRSLLPSELALSLMLLPGPA